MNNANSPWPVAPPQIPLPKLAETILRLSDHYIKNPQAATPWIETHCQQAYRYYFLPLNYIRNVGVIKRGQQLGFFDDLNHFIDWGAGPGTASLALSHTLTTKTKITEQILIDHSPEVLKLFSDLHTDLQNAKVSTKTELSQYLKTKEKTCLIFSYSLTEVSDLPKSWNQFEAVMILEPSTSQDGRMLLKLREELIKNGFHIWAPCTHQQSCPLLNESKHDWCHDRFHVQSPDWFQKLENQLPMKNKTVTTSYVLARKRTPPEQLMNLARLTGDSMEEKGKTRQLVCRGPKREFLSWMHKNTHSQTLARGELIELPADLQIKSNELRAQFTPITVMTKKID